MSKWTIYSADLAASSQSSTNQIMPYSCLRRIGRGGGAVRGGGIRRVDLYHFSLLLSLTHISLSYFSCLQSLNTLVNVTLEVKTEMVCATQMVSSDKGDSTFSPSCVKVQVGCSLCCSVGHSEDVWTTCSVVA